MRTAQRLLDRMSGLIPANPCSRVPLPRLDKRIVVPLAAEAVSALAGAMPARYELAAGLHPKVIQERLGHATIAETMDTYGHLFPMPASTAAARSMPCSPRLACAQCAPGNDHEHAAAGQGLGGGRAGL